MTTRLIQGLLGISGAIVYGSGDAEKQCATLSFNLKNWTPSDLSFRLDEKFGILTRVGLHCAPSAHRTIGSFSDGTVRLSMSYLSTEEDIEQTLQAIKTLARQGV